MAAEGPAKVNIFLITTACILSFTASFIFLPPIAQAVADAVTVSLSVNLSQPSTDRLTAIPEMRSGADGANDSVRFFLTVRTAIDNDDVILFQQSALATSNSAGIFDGNIIFSGIGADTYDIGIKSTEHLTLILDNVDLSSSTPLNFTQFDNTLTATGTRRLMSGDINGDGTSVANSGDDVINAIDLSLLLDDLDLADATISKKTNLNKDTVINSVDLSLILDNLDEEGEK